MAFINNNNIKNLVTLEPTKFNNESGKIGALYHYFTCKKQNNDSF